MEQSLRGVLADAENQTECKSAMVENTFAPLKLELLTALRIR
jgi:hypothetical protein